MKLGLSPDLLSTATSIASSVLGPKKTGGGGGSAYPEMVPNVNVNPAFQQSFTPQFSPVMQQQQDSPGGSQSATPTQYATPAQTAIPSSAPPPSVGPAPYTSAPLSYPLPGSDTLYGGTLTPTLPVGGPPVFQQSGSNVQDLLKTGLIVIGAVMGLQILNKKSPMGNVTKKYKKNRKYKTKAIL